MEFYSFSLLPLNVVHNLPGLTELKEKVTLLWSNSNSILMTINTSRRESTPTQVNLEIALSQYIKSGTYIPTCQTFLSLAQLVIKQILWFPVLAAK